jgi:hypothetical protein
MSGLMRLRFLFLKFLSVLFAAMLFVAANPSPETARANEVTVNGVTLVNKGLVGVGRIPASQRDKFGETFGSSSGMATDLSSWSHSPDGYHGTIFLLPDRGYNVAGTTDYQPRFNKISIVFNPVADASKLPADKRQHEVMATIADTIKFTDAEGMPMTGLDPDQGGIRPAAKGFPDMPQASNGHVSLDSEAIVRLPDGSFFVSDEYGPYIYRFSAAGRMISAIRPPEAFIAKRNGKEDFSSNNPGPNGKEPSPKDPESGRQNNQGFEGMAMIPGGKTLAVILQSATRQDGGTAPDTRRNTRILFYDVSDLDHAKLIRENVVPLPVFTDSGKQKVAAQSELLAISETQFLLLCRDSGNGYGQHGTTSLYRRIELLDTSKATNIAGTAYDDATPVAPDGKIVDVVVPATLTSFIDMNDNHELNKFGLHQGAPNDRDNLSEKWESMGLLPALDPAAPNDYFLFVGNDNDFITQNGYQVGAAYKDESGADVDTMLLVYRVTVPGLNKR